MKIELEDKLILSAARTVRIKIQMGNFAPEIDAVDALVKEVLRQALIQEVAESGCDAKELARQSLKGERRRK